MAVRLLLCFLVKCGGSLEFVIVLSNDVVIGKSMLGVGYTT